jgi:hypothetical protein
MSETIEKLPCPECGGDAKGFSWTVGNGSEDFGWCAQIVCESCGFTDGYYFAWEKDKAISLAVKDWNVRMPRVRSSFCRVRFVEAKRDFIPISQPTKDWRAYGSDARCVMLRRS